MNDVSNKVGTTIARDIKVASIPTAADQIIKEYEPDLDHLEKAENKQTEQPAPNKLTGAEAQLAIQLIGAGRLAAILRDANFCIKMSRGMKP